MDGMIWCEKKNPQYLNGMIWCEKKNPQDFPQNTVMLETLQISLKTINKKLSLASIKIPRDP